MHVDASRTGVPMQCSWRGREVSTWLGLGGGAGCVGRRAACAVACAVTCDTCAVPTLTRPIVSYSLRSSRSLTGPTGGCSWHTLRTRGSQGVPQPTCACASVPVHVHCTLTFSARGPNHGDHALGAMPMVPVLPVALARAVTGSTLFATATHGAAYTLLDRLRPSFEPPGAVARPWPAASASAASSRGRNGNWRSTAMTMAAAGVLYWTEWDTGSRCTFVTCLQPLRATLLSWQLSRTPRFRSTSYELPHSPAAARIMSACQTERPPSTSTSSNTRRSNSRCTGPRGRPCGVRPASVWRWALWIPGRSLGRKALAACTATHRARDDQRRRSGRIAQTRIRWANRGSRWTQERRSAMWAGYA